MREIICPISSEKANENVVRITAFWVIMLTGLFILVPNPYIPLYLAVDFYIRAFTKSKFSPLSWMSAGITRWLKLEPHMIDKAPKIFAARVGLLFSILMFSMAIFGLVVPAVIIASVLVLFAFLECGLNFCAGCWVYTYIVVPLYRDK
jgi:hypothetical protein